MISCGNGDSEEKTLRCVALRCRSTGYERLDRNGDELRRVEPELCCEQVANFRLLVNFSGTWHVI